MEVECHDHRVLSWYFTGVSFVGCQVHVNHSATCVCVCFSVYIHVLLTPPLSPMAEVAPSQQALVLYTAYTVSTTDLDIFSLKLLRASLIDNQLVKLLCRTSDCTCWKLMCDRLTKCQKLGV